MASRAARDLRAPDSKWVFKAPKAGLSKLQGLLWFPGLPWLKRLLRLTDFHSITGLLGLSGTTGLGYQGSQDN